MGRICFIIYRLDMGRHTCSKKLNLKCETLMHQLCVSFCNVVFCTVVVLGRDCIGCAKTGSGKTAAFALPILQKLCEDPYGIFALVLSPTRYIAVFVIPENMHC